MYKELSMFPETILIAEDGDVLTVNGVEFTLEADGCGGKYYLVTEHEYEEKDTYPWKHLRNSDGVALMNKSQLFSALRYNSYKIY